MMVLLADRLNEVAENLRQLEEDLGAATRFIAEHEVLHVKIKKDIPTVISYQGRRYVLDARN